MVTRHSFKWQPYEEEETPNDMFYSSDDGDESPSGYWTKESSDEQIDAVQIWSVGPDGIDDGGLIDKSFSSDKEKRKDDIRFIIPVATPTRLDKK